MKKNEQIRIALVSLRPFIEIQSIWFSTRNTFLDSSAFEDVAYQEVYNNIDRIRDSNGDLAVIVSTIRNNIKRAMGRFAKRRELMRLKLLEQDQNDLLLSCQAGVSLNRIKILEELRIFDLRLGFMFEQTIIMGKPFDNAGDKSYFYRGLKKFAEERRGQIIGPCGDYCDEFYLLYGNT